MKFNVLIALLGITSAQSFLQEDNEFLVEDFEETELSKSSFLQTFDQSIGDIPSMTKKNIEVLSDTIDDILKLKNIWLFDPKFKSLLQGHRQLAQDSKVFGFDISNVIMDIKLVCDSGIRDIEKVERTFRLRKKYHPKLAASPKKDFFIWKKIYKSLVGDLAYQVTKIEGILKTFHQIDVTAQKLQKEFQGAITHEEDSIKAIVSKVQKQIQHLKSQIAHTGCGLIQGETTFTPQCQKARELRIQENHWEDKMFSANNPHRNKLQAFYGQGQKVVQLRKLVHIRKDSFHNKTKAHDSNIAKLSDKSTPFGTVADRDEIVGHVEPKLAALKTFLENKAKHLIDTKHALDKKLIWG